MIKAKTNNEFYNLIVVERGVELGKPQLITNGDILALTDEDIRKKYLFFGEEELADIVTFPTLLCDYEDDFCYLGKIKNVDVGEKTTTFEFDCVLFNTLQQTYFKHQLLNLSDALQIKKVTCCSELDEIHWAIKRANLISILSDYEKEVA
jgi:hypothetical protein